ncbi:MAG: hypothetical protein WKF81_10050 [Thermomicrobiales bacterium]
MRHRVAEGGQIADGVGQLAFAAEAVADARTDSIVADDFFEIGQVAAFERLSECRCSVRCRVVLRVFLVQFGADRRRQAGDIAGEGGVDAQAISPASIIPVYGEFDFELTWSANPGYG